MNKENFVLNEETTVKEILDYAHLYCKELPNCDEQDELCFNCKLKFICGGFIEEWRLPKTYMEDFFEKFPNARTMSNNDTPVACRDDIYGTTTNVCQGNCLKCWSQTYKEN